ncbi:MAG TPA: hypothetical protein VHQ20_00185 [Patescibacteria group bacterium]|jgi:hypothetical protein|nr:hypothetical protein [Patescibacteria group bacterium]
MGKQKITFDEVFKIWLDAEVLQIEGRDILSVAQSKGFNSITEWRLATALRLGMDTKPWTLEKIENPNETFPKIIIGPYQGWSKFFKNELGTSFEQALEIPEFLEWCSHHDRIIPLSQKFPLPTTIILFRKPDGTLIHVEGGHRICAVAYSKKVDRPIIFPDDLPVTAAIADISDEEIKKLIAFLERGTSKSV